MKCIRLEVYIHIPDGENPNGWDICEALGPDVVAWDWHEQIDCPTIVDGTCPSCGRYTEPTHSDLEAVESLACGECSRVAT